MKQLVTPFGPVEVRIDGRSIPYTAFSPESLPPQCLHVLGRYRIRIHFKPDGKEHEISCVFIPNGTYRHYIESGERLECQAFYRDDGMKMSIGLEGEAGYNSDGSRECSYDYDADYLGNGVSYLILDGTKKETFVFGIAWIDRVEEGVRGAAEISRDAETWFGADPTWY